MCVCVFNNSLIVDAMGNIQCGVMSSGGAGPVSTGGGGPCRPCEMEEGQQRAASTCYHRVANVRGRHTTLRYVHGTTLLRRIHV